MTSSEKALNQWKKANLSFILYQDFIKDRGVCNRFNLSVADLMFISNFKGGNASVMGSTNEIIESLKSYSDCLREIDRTFGKRNLRSLTASELDVLVELCTKSFRDLDAHPINGFSYSYWSAMLCAFFPHLLPILDRWVVTNLGIPHEKDSQGQVKNIKQYYPEVIRRFKMQTAKMGCAVRELDMLLFSTRPN